VSITTIEWLRAADPFNLPPAITIGSSILYDEAQVELWLLQQTAPVKISTQQSQGANQDKSRHTLSEPNLSEFVF
jgi:hypothetical protein